MDLSEWGITCKEFCPRKGKQRDDNSKRPGQQASKAKELPPRICYNCRQPEHFANKFPNLGRTSHIHRGKAPKQVRIIITRSRIFKWSKVSVSSWVLFLLENTSLYDLPSIVVCEQPPWTFDGNICASWCPKIPLLATSLSQSCLILKSWNVFILIFLTTLWTYKTWIERVKLCLYDSSIIRSCRLHP
jgi:hypothetical protein